MSQSYFVYREAANANELEILLRLRYHAFRDSQLKGFVAENETGLDLDCYDLRSRHFGLFHHAENHTVAVGYHRVVSDEYGPHWQNIMTLASQSSQQYERVCQTPVKPLPLMTYHPQAKILEDYYNQLKSEGRKICEGSRLTLSEPFRSIELVRHIIGSAVTIFFDICRYDLGLVALSPSHRRFYTPFGFTDVDQINVFKIFGVSLTCLKITANAIPKTLKNSIHQMGEAFEETGMICYFPDRPGEYLVTQSDLNR